MKGGELGGRELLGAGVRAETQRGEGLADAVGFGKSSQVVHQGFAFFRETQFHKIQETSFVAQGKFCALARKPQRDESGSDFRRRVERIARNFEDKFGARIELGEDREITVIAPARLGNEAMSNFGLDDDVDFVDPLGKRKKVMEDGRSNVVGQIAVDTDPPAGGNCGDVGFQNVAGDDVEVGKFLREAVQTGDERRVEFDGVDERAGREKMRGHFAVPGADFDPTVLIVARKWRRGMRRNAYGTRDLFAPVEVLQEVLAEALASHGGNSVARGATRDPAKRGRTGAALVVTMSRAISL